MAGIIGRFGLDALHASWSQHHVDVTVTDDGREWHFRRTAVSSVAERDESCGSAVGRTPGMCCDRTTDRRPSVQISILVSSGRCRASVRDSHDGTRGDYRVAGRRPTFRRDSRRSTATVHLTCGPDQRSRPGRGLLPVGSSAMSSLVLDLLVGTLGLVGLMGSRGEVLGVGVGVGRRIVRLLRFAGLGVFLVHEVRVTQKAGVETGQRRTRRPEKSRHSRPPATTGRRIRT